MKPIRVLSLFDGIATARYVLDQLGIPVEAYYASEIDPNAIKVAKHHYPDIIEVGDITKLKGSDFPDIDLVCGGSPCQSVSRARSDRENLEGKSGLFWHYHRLVEETKPKYFFLENVVMDKEPEATISRAMGVSPRRLDSGWFSPQTRERLYWTNIPQTERPLPSDKVLGDILVHPQDAPQKYWYKRPFTLTGKFPVVAMLDIKGMDFMKRVLSPNHKCHTLTAVCGGHQMRKVLQDGRPRKLLPVEYEALQGLPHGYTGVAGASDSSRWKALGNGWQADTVKYLWQGLVQ